MQLKQTLLASAALAAGGLLMPVSGLLPVGAPAAAATHIGVSISFGTFYDRLAPHGNWVSYHNTYVFVPRGLAAGWRPYTVGRWVYTAPHGWLWVSAEPFGWATYHYGRWGYAEDIGWYWVPGHRWAPAWVAWRRSDSYIAWAPLPVDYPDDRFSLQVSFGNVPTFYWQVVKAPAFLSADINRVIIRDRTRERALIGRMQPLGGLRVVNKTVVNNVVSVKFVEKKTSRKVIVNRVRKADDPRMAGRLSGHTVGIFDPQVAKSGAKDKPKQVTTVEQVKAAHKTAGGKNSDLSVKQQQVDQSGQTKKQQRTGQANHGEKDKQQAGKTDRGKAEHAKTKRQQSGQVDKTKEKQRTGKADRAEKKQQQAGAGKTEHAKNKQERAGKADKARKRQEQAGKADEATKKQRTGQAGQSRKKQLQSSQAEHKKNKQRQSSRADHAGKKQQQTGWTNRAEKKQQVGNAEQSKKKQGSTIE